MIFLFYQTSKDKISGIDQVTFVCKRSVIWWKESPSNILNDTERKCKNTKCSLEVRASSSGQLHKDVPYNGRLWRIKNITLTLKSKQQIFSLSCLLLLLPSIHLHSLHSERDRPLGTPYVVSPTQKRLPRRFLPSSSPWPPSDRWL